MKAPESNPSIPCEVLLEDAAFVVLKKPVGVASEPGARHMRDTILNGAFAQWGKELALLGAPRDWGLVHRLDRMTSGCLIIGRTAAAYDSLRGQFAARTIGKTYLALVKGRLPSSSGSCDYPIAEVRRGSLKVAVVGRNGDEAGTEWRTIGRLGEYSLLSVGITTGRLHQIRAHMAYIGAPVVGDHIYRPLMPPNANAQSGGDRGLMLHAWKLEFTHPGTGLRVLVVAPPPTELVNRIRELIPGLWVGD
ncbi:MAG: RluA family pseudouridine synthase [Phycisphaerales bacterium]|nr:RluA family pseudouridine synthase [Phycisphaerales bacterium]